MDVITSILYLASSALLYPVIIGLLVLGGTALLEIGGLLRELGERRANVRSWRNFQKLQTESLTEDPALTGRNFLSSGDYTGLLRIFARCIEASAGSSLTLEKGLTDIELEAASRISRLNLFARISPMLGLAGTLIPLGPALLGISHGDLESLAQNLVVAFSTTVLGLFAGGVFFAIGAIRRQVYAQDIANAEFVFQCLTQTRESEQDPAYV